MLNLSIDTLGVPTSTAISGIELDRWSGSYSGALGSRPSIRIIVVMVLITTERFWRTCQGLE